jgi:PKD repeat protein
MRFSKFYALFWVMCSLTLFMTPGSSQNNTVEAVFTATPTSGQVPLTVQFDASGSTGSNLTYEWDFGDGTTGTGKQIEHTFTESDVYVVKLTVKDAPNSAEVSQGIFVQDPQENGVYALTPGDTLVAVDGVTFVTKEDYTTAPIKLRVVETNAPNLPLPESREVVSRYYQFYSLNVRQFRNGVGDYWIGIPVPDGIDGTKVWMAQYLYNPNEPIAIDEEGQAYFESWSDNGVFYHSKTRMLYGRFSGYPDLENRVIVLVANQYHETPVLEKLPWE